MEHVNTNQLENSSRKFSFFKRKRNGRLQNDSADENTNNSTFNECRSRYDMASVVDRKMKNENISKQNSGSINNILLSFRRRMRSKKRSKSTNAEFQLNSSQDLDLNSDLVKYTTESLTSDDNYLNDNSKKLFKEKKFKSYRSVQDFNISKKVLFIFYY